MYKFHPDYKQPDNEESKLWRYLDFTKLVSLLDTKNLFFTRVDKFDDPFEGSIPKSTKEERFKRFQHYSAYKIFPEMRKYTVINCWHMNQHESAAMWRLYLKSNEGIALQTTYKKLISSIIDEEDVSIGMVKYIDYETEFFDTQNILYPFLHKRKSFEYENEVRAIIFKPPNGPWFNNENIKNGILIKVDLSVLIERIYVAPDAPEWFTDLVRAVVNKYEYNFEVFQSDMNKIPIY